MKLLNPPLVCFLLVGFVLSNPVFSSASTDDQNQHNNPGGFLEDNSRDSPFRFFNSADKPISSPAFAQFNAQYQNRWHASHRAKDGKVRLLYGTVSKSYGNEPEEGARSFLKETHQLFGFASDLSDLKTVRVDNTTERHHVRFQQLFHGIPVEGSDVLVHSNTHGQITMVQNGAVADIKVTNRNVLEEEAAKTIARNHIGSTTSPGATLYDSQASNLIVRIDDQYKYIWKIITSTRNPFSYWVYHIDAETGAILYHGDEISSIKSGRGTAYKSNVNWHRNKTSRVRLANMLSVRDGNPGHLIGRHISILDNNGNDPLSKNLSFVYNPSVQKDFFDAAHSYYQFETIWNWWNDRILKKYSLSTPQFFHSHIIPAVVNVNNFCNAFYSSNLFGTNPPIPGYGFGDEHSCAFGSEDLSNDIDVVRHEFAHAIMDWAGFRPQFGGALDGYGRSMGEGNADWYAFLFTPKDPLIGDVAFLWLGGFLRDLDSTRMYPRDVDYPAFGLPEEHYTGEIWGGYLYDLYKIMKRKAIPFVYRSSYYFSAAGGHRDGLPDFFDGLSAQILAELDLTGKTTSAVKAWGAWTSRGINGFFRQPYAHASDYFFNGLPGSDDSASIFLKFPPNKSIKTSGNLLTSGDIHEYLVEVTEPIASLSAKMKGARKGGILAPHIDLFDSSQVLLAPGITKGNAASVTRSNLEPGLYVLVATGLASSEARGNYTLTVKAKK